MSDPFEFPATPHERKHGPRGYATYESFRPWVRDEFTFRCVYCRTREAWTRGPTTFHLDHFLPVALRPDLAVEYDNMLYACSTCNAYKRERSTPDPLAVLTRDGIEVDAAGVCVSKTPAAAEVIDILRLNDPQAVEFRRLWIEIVRLAELSRPDLYRQVMGFPQDLPRLRTLRPPDGNTRPNGIAQSYHEQRQRGELPETH